MAKITIETEVAATKAIILAALESLIKGMPRGKLVRVILEVVVVSDPLTKTEEALLESLRQSDPKIFGTIIKEAREELGWNQERLANAVGYRDNSIISLWEHGNRLLPVRAIRELLRVLPSLDSKLRLRGLIPSDAPKEE